jgi:hypothetical protein
MMDTAAESILLLIFGRWERVDQLRDQLDDV